MTIAPVGSPAARTGAGERRAPGVRHAVVALEMAFFAELTSGSRFGAAVERYAGRRGIELARRAVAIADRGPSRR